MDNKIALYSPPTRSVYFWVVRHLQSPIEQGPLTR